MRQIVLDTETTGLEPEQGHRIIEIGAVELIDRRLSGRNFHCYLNPERDIEAGALEVHGITREFLADKPLFADVAKELEQFVEGGELIIHNAPFDLGFLDYEYALLGLGQNAFSSGKPLIDTLEVAKELRPGQRNNLDALCKHYEIDNSSRTLHGALLDAEILAEVYLAMTGGQVALGLTVGAASQDSIEEMDAWSGERPALKVVRASGEELEAHQQRLEAIKEASGVCVWLQEKEPAPF